MKPDEELALRLEKFRHIVITSAVYGYVYLAIGFRGGGDPDTQDRFQKHAVFWNITFSAFQYATILAIGRVYDPKKKYSAEKMLKFAADHRGLFSRRATAKEFATLDDELQKRQRLYANKLKGLRDEVFAHMGEMEELEREVMFLNLRNREVEDLVLFPLRLYRALVALKNGADSPILRDVPSLITDVVNARKDPTYDDWDHIKAVSGTLDFLDWLRGQPLDS